MLGLTTSRIEAPATEGHRRDIQGLRGVAVLAVLGFHAGVPGMGGGYVGVDVFFVISGFLITGLIARDLEVGGGAGLAVFWARRARRLLPASTTVLLAVALLTLAFLPVTTWESVARDVSLSSVFSLNWMLARDSVDYLASSAVPSPVQHYWSLGVEEQFYVIWPVLLFGALRIARLTRVGKRTILVLASLAVGLPSFLLSLQLTRSEPARAYFVTTTRAWELSVGALLFAVVSSAPVERRAARILGPVGLAAILAAVVVLEGTTAFPGWAAGVPVLGTAAVLGAGSGRATSMTSQVLGSRLLHAVGDHSYSLYLWHWPLLVVAGWMWGGRDLAVGLPHSVAVLLAAGALSVVTVRFVENPFRHRPLSPAAAPRRWGMVGAGCAAAGCAAALLLVQLVPPVPHSSTGAAGAGALGAGQSEQPGSVEFMVPHYLEADDDLATLDGRLCISGVTGADVVTCTLGSAEAEIHLAVVGDSKMHQWLPAIEKVATDLGWHVTTYLKSSCPFLDVDAGLEGRANPDCVSHNRARMAELLSDADLDVVLTSQVASLIQGRGSDDDRRAAMVGSLQRTWGTLERAGREVIVLVDNPNPGFEVVPCVAQNEAQLGLCAFDRAAGEERSGAAAQVPALNGIDGVSRIDVRDRVCGEVLCWPVVGNTLVFRRGSHLTATYVRSMTPWVRDALVRAMDE